MSGRDATPIPAHLGSEFLLWLWWASEAQDTVFQLPDPVGTITLWVDNRLAFRQPSDTKVTAVLTGENPSTSLEARAALAGGKVLQDLRIMLKRDDREFSATLRGASLDVGGLKLPQALSENADEIVIDRMFLYEEFTLVLGGLMGHFADLRTSATWRTDVLPAMRAWLMGQDET